MQFIDFDALCTLIKSYVEKDALITFHSIGDRDAVGSATALSKYLPRSVIATPDFLTNNAKRMLDLVDYKNKIGSKFENKVAVIVLDANNLEVLGKFSPYLENFKGELIFIDHHVRPLEEEANKINANVFNDESYNSTASIIFDMFKHNHFDIDKETAILLLNGITADSADFQNADSRTFMQIAELLSTSKITYSTLKEYYHAIVPVENRLMTINDVRASTAENVGRYVIMYGKATAHANVAADAALSLGADAAVFWVVTESEASISARLRAPLDKTLGIHLGEIMQGISFLVGGSGGGHACAAGAYGHKKENAEVAGRKVVEKVKDKMK